MRCSYLLTYLYLLVFKFKFTLNTGTGVQDNQKQLQTTPKAYFLRHYCIRWMLLHLCTIY